MASSSTEGAETKMMMPRLAIHVPVDVYIHVRLHMLQVVKGYKQPITYCIDLYTKFLLVGRSVCRV